MVAQPKHNFFQRLSLFIVMPLNSFSLLKGYTMEVSPSVAGGSTGRFDVDDILPLPLLGVGVQLGLY